MIEIFNEMKAAQGQQAPSAVLHAIRHLKPRLFGQGCVANPRDTYGYRCGLRLALTKNPSVFNVPSSVQHHTSARHTHPALVCIRPPTAPWRRTRQYSQPMIDRFSRFHPMPLMNAAW